MVVAYKVDLGKDCCACQVGNEVLNVREWVAVIQYDIVEVAEITTWPPASTRLPDDV